VSSDTRRAQVRETIGQRKLEEEWNRYQRDMRNEAYVDLRLDDGPQPAASPAPAAAPTTTPSPPTPTPNSGG